MKKEKGFIRQLFSTGASAARTIDLVIKSGEANAIVLLDDEVVEGIEKLVANGHSRKSAEEKYAHLR